MTGLFILAVAMGTIAPLLIPAAGPLSRRLWPGPTVKGPADIYVQAFQALVVLIGLSAVALCATAIAWLTASAVGWRGATWFSLLPMLCLLAVISGTWFRSRR